MPKNAGTIITKEDEPENADDHTVLSTKDRALMLVKLGELRQKNRHSPEVQIPGQAEIRIVNKI
jgi:hypothetical protein